LVEQEKLMARLKERFEKEILPALQERLGYKNINEVPRPVKVVVNIGVGEAIQDSKRLESAIQDLAKITGQKPVTRQSRRAIANFKLREGVPIGCSVTLRGKMMYEFLDRLISIALPRVRDFRGVSRKGMDGRGNYTLGVKEQIIFPEIDYDKVDKIRGMNITIVTTAKNNADGLALMEVLGMPLVRQNKV